MSGPGPTKLQFNLYITREHKAALKRAAHREKKTMTSFITDALDGLVKRVEKKHGKPKPAPIYKAKWVKRLRKGNKKAA